MSVIENGKMTAQKRGGRPDVELDVAAPPPLQAAAGPAMGAMQFCAFASISRMTLWRLIRSGEILQIHVGTKSLILIDSWNRYVAREIAANEARRTPAEPEPVRRGRGRPRRIVA
jgi:hypothetical protein